LISLVGLVGSDVGGDDVVEGMNEVAKAERDIVVSSFDKSKCDIKSNEKIFILKIKFMNN